MDIMAGLWHMNDNFEGCWSFLSYWKEWEVVLWQKCFWNPRGSRFSCPTNHCYYLIHPPDVCISVKWELSCRRPVAKEEVHLCYLHHKMRSLSENKFPSLCLYMCLHVSEVYDHKAAVGRICWVQSLCMVHSLTAEEDLVSFWMQVLMLPLIHVW